MTESAAPATGPRARPRSGPDRITVALCSVTAFLVVLALLGMQMRHPSTPAARTRPVVFRKVYVTTVVQRVPAGASPSPRPASVTQTVSSAPTSAPAPAAPVATRSSGAR